MKLVRVMLCSLFSGGALAQAPSAPVAQSSSASLAALQPEALSKPAFPPVHAEFFTAATPTADTVNTFLKQLWGYDENRIWQVAAILKTNAPGVAKVVVIVADKNHPDKTQQTVFFTTPDGAHAIADNVIDFGATPFARNTALSMQELQQTDPRAGQKAASFCWWSSATCNARTAKMRGPLWISS